MREVGDGLWLALKIWAATSPAKGGEAEPCSECPCNAWDFLSFPGNSEPPAAFP